MNEITNKKTAYDKLREMGIDFSRPHLPLYSLTGENAFLVGKFIEKQTISSENGEYTILVFDVEKGELYNKNNNIEEVVGRIGVFSTSKLEMLLFFDYVQTEDGKFEKIENIKVGKKVVIVYKGIKEVKNGKRKLRIHDFSFKMLD